MKISENQFLTETIDNKRYYNVTVDDKLYKLPSVTTIISSMSDQSALAKWRQRVGEAEADKISRFSVNRGSCMHKKLELWFNSLYVEDQEERLRRVNKQMEEFIKQEHYTQEEYLCGDKLFNKLYLCGFFERVNRVEGMEFPLYSLAGGGYAGRVDCVYNTAGGDKVLLDFKTSKHHKKKEWLSSYYLQLAAYAQAWKQLYEQELDHAELWVAVEDDTPQLFYVTREELRQWLRVFMEMVEAYHKRFDKVLLSNDDCSLELPF